MISERRKVRGDEAYQVPNTISDDTIATSERSKLVALENNGFAVEGISYFSDMLDPLALHNLPSQAVRLEAPREQQ